MAEKCIDCDQPAVGRCEEDGAGPFCEWHLREYERWQYYEDEDEAEEEEEEDD